MVQENMGFYLRKSVSVGPFRINFSKSGVGVSAGIKGLRVGTGPRGNYISVGVGGLYYRATLPSPSVSTPPQPLSNSSTPPNVVFQPTIGVGPMTALESAPVTSMLDSSSTDLLSELNGKAKRPNYWKWTAVASLIALWLSAQASSPIVMPAVFVAALALTIYIGIRDTVAKTAVLCYQLDAPNEQVFDALHSAFASVTSCRKTWRIGAKGTVHDTKYHAGASSLVTRKDASFGKGLPPKVKCNLEVPFVKGGALALYFMPDQVLVYSSSSVGAVSYRDLRFGGTPQRFIEDGSLPSDAEVVDRTWKYVNKKGGPDKRFKDNRELPIALYEELRFQSASGLNEVFQVSRHSISGALRAALTSMEKALPVIQRT